jgi:TPR repeat protein
MEGLSPRGQKNMFRKCLTLFALLLALPLAAATTEYETGLTAFKNADYAKALRVFSRLARDGHSDAQLKLGLMYHYGLGVKEDDRRAYEWIRKAAEQANAEAQFQLGNMYVYGFGIPKGEEDPDLQGVQWFFKAALQGHAEAQYNLGLMFLAGKGIQQSQEEGMKWITRAAEAGSPAAQSFLGGYK